MIYTCTTNPSLDYYMTFSKEVVSDTNNRSDIEMYDAGGKGVNVSIALNNFHIPSVALGFLGGFTKDFYLKYIANYPFIQPLFTTIKDNTRINVKIMDNKYETGLNARGPFITSEEFAKFKNRFNSIYKDDYFVLCGNIQDEIEDSLNSLIHELANDGINMVFDTDKPLVDKCLDVNPILVKINNSVLENNNEEDIIKEGQRLIKQGAKAVMYSAAHCDSYLIGSDYIYRSANREDNLVNTTGSADSMVAGYLYCKIRGGSDLECFKYAVAAASSTTNSNDLGSKKIIDDVYSDVKVDIL